MDLVPVIGKELVLIAKEPENKNVNLVEEKALADPILWRPTPCSKK